MFFYLMSGAIFLRPKKIENVTIFLQKCNQKVALFKEQHKMKNNSSVAYAKKR